MSARVCIVSFEDWDGMEHAVEVSAETLYEAAALGLKEFRAFARPRSCENAISNGMTARFFQGDRPTCRQPRGR